MTTPRHTFDHGPTPDETHTCIECDTEYCVADMAARGPGYICYKCDAKRE